MLDFITLPIMEWLGIPSVIVLLAIIIVLILLFKD